MNNPDQVTTWWKVFWHMVKPYKWAIAAIAGAIAGLLIARWV